MDWIVVEGKDRESAIEIGLEKLGISRKDAEIRDIGAIKKLFGAGGTVFRIRIRKSETPVEPVSIPEPAPPRRESEEREERPRRESSFRDRPPRRESSDRDRPPPRREEESRYPRRDRYPDQQRDSGDRDRDRDRDRGPDRGRDDRPPRRESSYRDRPPRRDVPDRDQPPRRETSDRDRPPPRREEESRYPRRDRYPGQQRDSGDRDRDRGPDRDRSRDDQPPRRESPYRDRPPRRREEEEPRFTPPVEPEDTFVEEEEEGEFEEREEREERAPEREFEQEPETEPTPEELELVQKLESILSEIFSGMQITAEVSGSIRGGRIEFTVQSDDSGLLIGKQGATLEALEHVMEIIANKQSTHRYQVTLDTENYRDRKKEKLEDLALRMARKAKETGRPVPISPMKASERKLIHSILQQDSQVETKSEGEGSRRRVIIYPRRNRHR